MNDDAPETDLTTERLRIRPVRVEDSETLYAIRQLVSEFQGGSDRTLGETRAMYAAMADHAPGSVDGWHQFVVIEKETGVIVGDIGVNYGGPGPRQVEIGYSLHPAHQRRGLAVEAVTRMLDHLFGDAGIHRCVALTDPRNQRSIVLLERLGFRREGHFIQSYWARDRWVDDYAYALLADEWRSRSR